MHWTSGACGRASTFDGITLSEMLMYATSSTLIPWSHDIFHCLHTFCTQTWWWPVLLWHKAPRGKKCSPELIFLEAAASYNGMHS